MKNTKKLLTSLCSLFLVGTTVLSTSCKPGGSTGGGGNNGDIIIDETKTQLYVSNLQGGIGYEWFQKVIQRFEEKFADAEYTPGTTGVQIIPEYEYTVNGRWLLLPTDNYDVYFTENLTYNDYVRQDEILDITDVVKAPAKTSSTTTESVTIESKLSADQKEVLTVQKGNYYAIPHYEAYRGVSYDVDLFNENKLFFAANKDNGNDGFIIKTTDAKSAGPNGVSGDYDDGLPATIEEFFKLCDRMVSMTITPLIWPGQTVEYVEYLADAIADNISGADAVRLNFTYDSGANTTEIVTGFTDAGEPIVKNVAITPDNGYLLKQQLGKYYGLEVVEKIISKIDQYAHLLSNNDSNFTQYNSQEEYIYSNLENKPIGMIIDGSYWWNEAKGAYERSVGQYKERATTRNFAWMPMPTAIGEADRQSGAKKPVVRDLMHSYAFINAKVSTDPYRTQLAKDFLSFCYSDESLQEFTMTTGVPKGLNYELTSQQSAALNPFAKSVWEFRKNADVVTAMPSSTITVENEEELLWDLFKTNIVGEAYNTPFYAFIARETAEDYFKGQWITETDWKGSYSQYFTAGV